MTGVNKVFVLIAKQDEQDNPFFVQVHRGCLAAASHLEGMESSSSTSSSSSSSSSSPPTPSVRCEFHHPVHPTADEQVQLLSSVLDNYTSVAGDDSEGTGNTILAGIAIAPLMDGTVMTELIQRALEMNVPVVTYDSDAPSSQRLSYIRTDNIAFGKTLGKLLVQLRPEGGRMGVIGAAGARNLQERLDGLYQTLRHNEARGVVWELAAPATDNVDESPDMALQQMTTLLDSYPEISAMVSIAGWPMFNETGWVHLYERYRHRNITYVVADTFDVQWKLFMAGYVDGLVGQDPYNMGYQTVTHLNEYYNNPGTWKNNTITSGNDSIYGTVFFEMVRVPLTLPEAAVDHNYVGNLRYLGYAYFGLVVMTSLSAALWTVWQSDSRVVIASQPQFLLLICFGALVFGFGIVLLSFDDSPNDRGDSSSLSLDEDGLWKGYDRWDTYCTAFPWFAQLGFTIMFSALLSKTRSINKVFHNSTLQPELRIKVSQRDLYLPLVVLLLANVVNMTAWTVASPLHYVRKAHRGTDDWNRVISYYGTCAVSSTNDALPYLIVMAVLNLSALAVANWQACEARYIQSEFAESRYITLAMMFVLQAVLIGAPLLALVRDTPGAFYVVLTTMFFSVILAVLLLLFVPKIILVREHSLEDGREKQRHLESLRRHRLRLEHQASERRSTSAPTSASTILPSSPSSDSSPRQLESWDEIHLPTSALFDKDARFHNKSASSRSMIKSPTTPIIDLDPVSEEDGCIGQEFRPSFLNT